MPGVLHALLDEVTRTLQAFASAFPSQLRHHSGGGGELVVVGIVYRAAWRDLTARADISPRLTCHNRRVPPLCRISRFLFLGRQRSWPFLGSGSSLPSQSHHRSKLAVLGKKLPEVLDKSLGFPKNDSMSPA